MCSCRKIHGLIEGDFAMAITDEMRRHSAAHLTARAVMNLFDNVQVDIGPATEDGFYYDFDLEHRLSPEDFPKIEKEVARLIALDEPFSLLRTLGLAVIFSGVFCANTPKTRPSRKYLMMGCAVFALNGLVSTVSKLHQIAESFPTASAASFVMLSGLAKFVLCSVAVLVMKKRGGENAPKRRSAVWLIALSALIGGVSYLLQLIGAKNLPATVLYPIITGGAIIFSALAGRIFFKERIARMTLAGIALCFIGTCMFL